MSDDKDNGIAGTVMMDADEVAEAELDGTVMMADDAPSVGTDGTVMIGAGDNPALSSDGASSTVMMDAGANPAAQIPGRRSAPPPLPSPPPPAASTPPLSEDTSLPPALEPTPAPPQAADLTFDRSKLDAEDTTTPSPAPAKPAGNASFFKPAVPAKPAEPEAKKEPAAAKPAAAKPKEPASKPAASAPAKKPAAATTTGASKPAATTAGAEATTAGRPQGAPPQGAPPQGAPVAAPRPAKKKLPMWAQLLALVAVAAGVGHLVARMQGKSNTTPTAQPAARPAPQPANTPKPANTAATQPQPTAAPAQPAQPPPQPAEPAPAQPEPAAPAPVAKAADMSACVEKELGAKLPSDKLGFVCEASDAIRAQRDMTTLLASAGDDVRDARGEWNKLAWYRMAKLQIVRTRCCGDAAPLATAPALAACGVGEALTAIHEADRNQTSYDEGLKAYKKAVDCLFKANTMRMFGTITRPGPNQHQAFVKTLPTR